MMNELKKQLLEEIDEFRKTGDSFLRKEISVAEFKKASGGMGVYAERGGKKFMIRLRIPSGVTNVEELNTIYKLAKKYNLEKIHLTTRQAIQLHTMDFKDICDLMEECLDYDIFTRGAGGNYPRNVAISPLAGVDRGEIFDCTPYALAVGNHFLRKITSYHLPRKLKVSFSATTKDEGHVTIQDLGFLATKKDGKNGFAVYAGGGLGMNPKKAVLVEEFIDANEVLYYVEGMTKFFIAEGDYKNKARARVRYILERLGEEEFVKKLKEFVAVEKSNEDLELNIDHKEIVKQGITTQIKDKRLYVQKQPGLYSVYIHPMGGQLELKDFRAIIDFLERVEGVEVRLALVEGMYIRNLNGNEAEELLKLTESFSEVTRLGQSVSCIGIPICQMGRCNSQHLLSDIINYFKERNYNSDVMPRLFISGCPNSCGVHEIGNIGFMGMKVKHEDQFKDAFRLFIDGAIEVGKTQIGNEKGDFLPEDIPEFLYTLCEKIEKSGLNFNEFTEKNKNELDDLINKFAVNVL